MLLVGDAILDVYIYSQIVNQALYAPVPEVEERESVYSFGGNGLVARNLLELGGTVNLISVLGNDAEARRYDTLVHRNLEKCFVIDPTRRTTVKRRWFANGQAHLQANQVDNHDLPPRAEREVVRLIEKHVPRVDAVAVMDPQHGMLTLRVIQTLLRESKKHSKPLYVDAQISHRPSNHHLYAGAHAMVLNQKEAKAVYSRFDSQEPEKALRAIRKKFSLNNVVIKLGDKGSAALWGDAYIRTPGYSVRAIDACGAGDAFLAALCLADSDTPHEALRRANIWAALSTTIHGTIPPKKKDLMHELAQNSLA